MLGFLEAGYGNMILAAVCLLGMAGTWIASRKYQKLILQMDNVAGMQSKYLKQLKNKFETSYRVNRGVHNVGLFVEKNLMECRFLGIRLKRLGNAAVCSGGLAVLIGGAVALFCSYAGMALPAVARSFAGSLLAGATAGLYWKFANVAERERELHIYIHDYLENVLTSRLAAHPLKETVGREAAAEKASETPKTISELEAERQEPVQNESHREEIDYLKQSLDRIASGREPAQGEGKRKHPRFSKEEQRLIEDILREYFA